jgi:hypothetical protein
MATEIATRDDGEVHGDLTVASVAVVAQRMQMIHALMKGTMTPGVDHGVIPGTGGKPTLLKPGAEKVALMFRLAPKMETLKTFAPDGHLTVSTTCNVLGPDGNFLGSAEAICSTRESKYAYRKSQRKCPACGKENIRRSKNPPRDNPSAEPGWYCWKNTGGCGTNFHYDDEAITSQTEGQVPNLDLADSYNTVIRMAEKRAYIAAIRLVTGCSGIFDEENPQRQKQPEHQARPAPRQAPKQEQREPVMDPALKAKLDEYAKVLANCPQLEDVNTKAMPELKAMTDAKERMNKWSMLKDYCERQGWALADDKKSWVDTTMEQDEDDEDEGDAIDKIPF